MLEAKNLTSRIYNKKYAMIATQERPPLLKDKFEAKVPILHQIFDKNLLEILEEKYDGLPSDQVRSYIYQLCKAIDCCHRQNIIHRDITPENILISV